MTIDRFAQLWTAGSFPHIKQLLDDKVHHALFTGIAGSADAGLISDLFAQSKQPVLVLVENSKHAETLLDECRTFLDEDSVMLFPSRDAVPYNMKSPFGPTVEARFKVQANLLNSERKVYIAPVVALLQKMQTPRALFNKIIRLHTGDELSIATCTQWLVENGFHRENQVADLGTFSIRGGVVDVYPFLSENPFRIEFWGDTIDSIREFDIFSQKSKNTQAVAEIFPMREFTFNSRQVDDAIARMVLHCEEHRVDQWAVHKLEHQWKSTGDYEGVEWFLHWFEVPTATLLDFLPLDTIVVHDDLVPLDRRIDEAMQNYERHLERVPELYRPMISGPQLLLVPEHEIEENLGPFNTVYIETLDTPPDAEKFACSFSEQPQFVHELEPLVADLSAHHTQGFRCVIISPSLGHAERMRELLGDQAPFVEIATGFLQRGFIDKEGKLLLYSENQLFNRTFRPVKVKKQKSGIPITGFDALAPGDFVVHEDHGIAKFLGVERIKTADFPSDCMVLQYADNAKVYVPVEDFHKVQKYVGKESIEPALSKIGTNAWDKLKARTRESLKEMASELIELYAKRSFLEGIQFATDSMWQKEFEDAFIFEPTPDQLHAIKDVKEDMESKKPMDRLICGDVGFGKTEVAMRAAFKAVMSGYQVAILAPTTILAAQHFATFSERMSNFPVRVAMLSRFLKSKDQRPVVAKLKAGEVDILIGTHRILSQDIEFKNLGLLIIDEEQRFGVRHKEKLKQLRYKIDVLSLTATPIPRSLHMSLVGARDLSIINTPPRNRLPIETKVAEYHDELVRNALENEIERGGQVYFVNNRIKNLAAIQDRIEQLVPRARVISAHGQMDENELELVMKEFVAGRFDVLLSTVIIENGLDIPNVNTIIVNRADAMGLSQLYQLRGRVGRSSEQAYAYFLTPQFKSVNEISLKRLRALEQYTELGLGFQIAMRDLEIRGAGNILGTRQHGFIAAVGFELHGQLLQDAVKEINGEKIEEKKPEIKVEIPLEASIPTEYISDGATRISVYQELSSLIELASIDEIEKGLADRFGPLPPSVHALLLVIRIKLLATGVGCSKVAITREGWMQVAFEGAQEQLKETIKRFFERSDRHFEVSVDTHTMLKTKLAAEDRVEQALEALELLRKVA